MRRYTNALAAVLALAVVGSSTGRLAAAPAKIRIKLATVAPKDTSYHRILLEMGEKWRKASEGQVELVIYPGGNQGSEADTVRRMNIGELQAGLLSGVGLTEIDPGIGALQEIPMMFHTMAEFEYVREKLRPDLERRLLAKWFVSLNWGDSGWVRFFSRKAALSPNDFKGLKIFVSASGSDKQMRIMQSLGYKPVPLEFADALLQLQTGGVDAVPAVPVLALASQYYTVAKHMAMVNWAPLLGATVVTTQAWARVPSALRDTLVQAAVEAGRKIQDASRQENDQAVATMRTKAHLEVHEISPQIEQEWRAMAEGVYPKIRGAMVPADMFDRTRQLVGEYRTSYKTSSKAVFWRNKASFSGEALEAVLAAAQRPPSNEDSRTDRLVVTRRFEPQLRY